MRTSEGGQLGRSSLNAARKQRKHEERERCQERPKCDRRWLAHTRNALHEASAAALLELRTSLIAIGRRVPVLQLEQLEDSRHEHVSAFALAALRLG
jgi:hypothetical protein